MPYRLGLLSFALLCCADPLTAADKGINWIRDYRAGLETARRENKPVMVDFWAIWCGPCREMDRAVYSDPRMISASKDFVCVQVDIDKDTATAARYVARAIPAVIFLDPWETVLQRKNGLAQLGEMLDMMKPIPRDFSGVARNFESVAVNPQHHEALMGIGAFYEQAAYVAVARGFYSRALDSPRSREDRLARDQARMALGYLALRAKDSREAVKIFEKTCADCDPANEPDAMIALAVAYFRSNDPARARGAFERVIERFPDTEQARVARTNLQKIK